MGKYSGLKNRTIVFSLLLEMSSVLNKGWHLCNHNFICKSKPWACFTTLSHYRDTLKGSSWELLYRMMMILEYYFQECFDTTSVLSIILSSFTKWFRCNQHIWEEVKSWIFWLPANSALGVLCWHVKTLWVVHHFKVLLQSWLHL